MPAGQAPSIGQVHEARPRGHQGSSTGSVGARPYEQPLDDWLGDISDEDWSENPRERAERRHATPAYQELPGSEGDLWRDPAAVRPASDRRVATAEDHRAVIERRRLVAGLLVVTALALAVGIPVLLLRGGDQATVTPLPTPAVTPPAPTDTSPPPAPATPSPSPSTTQPTTPSTGGTSTFALPEGTKLQRGEGDPAVVRELQRALSAAGFDPGSADGTFGRRTEAAVVAFQEANGLSVDGRVGPETASALNSALADG